MKRLVAISFTFALVISLIAPVGTVLAVSGGVEAEVSPEGGVTALSGNTVGLIISHVVVGNASNTSRLIEVYNNSDQTVDVSNVCAYYHASTTSFAQAAQRYCFADSVLLGRTAYVLSADNLTGGLGNGDKGRVYIAKNKVVLDMVSWNMQADDSLPLIVPGNGSHSIERVLVNPGVYQDTGNSAADLRISVPPAPEPPRTDDEEGEEDEELEDPDVRDVPHECQNIPGKTLGDLPAGSEIDQDGNCFVNVCTNLPGFYAELPKGFVAGDDNTCVLDLLLLEVTEILPNPKGADAGNEFIEIYNPNDESVDLTWWLIHLNDDYQKVYSFPVGASIGAGEYAVFKDGDMKFSLRNSSGSVRLRSLDRQYVVDVPEWKNAKDDKSWALIDGVWQYADPSPGLENPVPVVPVLSQVGLADCGEGRERNPLTNRCRNIPTENELMPCKEGQYRSEETNRCRSIAGAAASVLKPCADDQFRNPETNRCKKIASAEELADCGEGRERNPETNRCRNVRTASMPLAPFAAEQVTQTAGGTFGWWAFGGVTLLAVGYAGWQWRFEMGRLMQKIRAAVSPGSKA